MQPAPKLKPQPLNPEPKNVNPKCRAKALSQSFLKASSMQANDLIGKPPPKPASPRAATLWVWVVGV